MTAVRARAGTNAGGWIEVPVLSGAVERDRWTAAVVDAVSRAHGERFDPDAGAPIREILAGIADAREESDLLVLVFLPTARPIAATVHVRLIAPPPPTFDWWREQGFALSPVRTAGAGHGMLASRTIDNRIETERWVAQQAVFVFTEGDTGIVVDVEPTGALVFERMQEGLTEILGSLTVEFDDGRVFAGEPVAGLFGSETDTWDIGEHVPA